MKMLFSTTLFLSLLAMPAFAQHASESAASDPATPRITLIASSAGGGDTVYGPGYTAPIHDGWG